MTTAGGLITDRYGVPQYSGEAELFEEYEERAWDLFHGREGTDGLQIATPVHLRAGLTGAAYESVRKLEHGKLKTKNSDGKATDVGMNLLLSTLKDSIAAELPVKTSELFFQAFYSTSVWRKNYETMQQYIVRREQDFKRLEDNSPGTQVSEQVRAMMLLCFGGLDPKEQTSVLSSCNNTYEFQKIAHAMRIQFPNAAGKPVHRRDYLGARQQGGPPTQQVRMQWKQKFSGKTRQVLAAEDYEPEPAEYDDDVYIEEGHDEEYEDGPTDEAYAGYSDDELMDVLLSDFPDLSEDPATAEAFATVAQHRFKKKKFMSGKSSTPSSPSQQAFGFQARGEMSFSEKAKDQRKSAVRFLKSVTPCTACQQKGHWAGDPECPVKKGKGRGKSSAPSAKKKGQPPKRKSPATTLLALHEAEPDHQDHDVSDAAMVESPTAEVEECYVTDNLITPENVKASVYRYDPINLNGTGTSDGQDVSHGIYTMAAYVVNDLNCQQLPDPTPEHLCRRKRVAFRHICDASETHGSAESFMALNCPKLCEHSSYRGGDERKLHRGANGHTRHVTCKERGCDRTIIIGHRKEPIEMWSYLVQILLCTKWGASERSAGLFRRVCQVREEHQALQDQAPLAGYPKKASQPATPQKTQGPIKNLSIASATPDGWDVVLSGNSTPSPVASGPSSSSKHPPTARIVRASRQRVWLYGVLISPDQDLPDFPDLPSEDMDILQPLPSDCELINDGSPFQGHRFDVVSSDPQAEHYCKQVMTHALANEPMSPEIFRFAFYLYGRLRLVRASAERITKPSKEEGESKGKREIDKSPMEPVRKLWAPIQYDIDDPNSVHLHECEVMMTVLPEEEESYALSADDPPGLAILDSGCTRTMHGKDWADQMEQGLLANGLSSAKRSKDQTFRGIGGKIQSKHVRIFPVGICGVHGEVHSAETPGNTPMLISRPFTEELGAVINLGKQTVSFTTLGIYDKPLLKTSRGHLALNLLDFDSSKMDEFESEDEETIQASLKSTTPPPGLSYDPAAQARDESDPFKNWLEEIDPAEYTNDFGGMNPDDYYDMQDDLATWRDDVLGIDPLTGRPFAQQQIPEDQAAVCENETLFADFASKHCCIRKTTNKKGKKLEDMCRSLDGDDFFEPFMVNRRESPSTHLLARSG